MRYVICFVALLGAQGCAGTRAAEAAREAFQTYRNCVVPAPEYVSEDDREQVERLEARIADLLNEACQ